MPTTRTASGDQVAFECYGDGPAVVFVAGAGAWSAIDETTPATAGLIADRGLSAIVYDRIGRGPNRAPGRIDLSREIDAIAALIGEVGGSAILCGHSSGCSISLRAAAEGLPVAGLVLWEAPMDPATEGVAEWTAAVERLLDSGQAGPAVEHYMKDIPPEVIGEMRGGPIWEQMVEQAESLRPDAQSLRWVYDGPFTDVFGRALGEKQVPVLALYGSETMPEMPAAAAAIAESVPGAEAVEIAGSWHDWEPQAMADALLGFVRNDVRRARDARPGDA